MTKTERTGFRNYFGMSKVEYEANGDDTYNLFVDDELVGSGLTFRDMAAQVKAL